MDKKIGKFPALKNDYVQAENVMVSNGENLGTASGNNPQYVLAAIADTLNNEGRFCTYNGELYHFAKIYDAEDGPHGFYQKMVNEPLELFKHYIYERFFTQLDALRRKPSKSIDEIIDFLRYKCRQMTVDVYQQYKVIFQDGIVFDLSGGVITPMYMGPDYFSLHYMRVNGSDILATYGLRELGGIPLSLMTLAKIQWPEDPDLWARKILEELGGLICGDIGKAIVTWVGDKNSFKSTLMNIVVNLWDLDQDVYVQTTDGVGDKFGRDNIMGKVLIYFPDIQEGRVSRSAVSFIKQLSGNDPFRQNIKNVTGGTKRLKIPIAVTANNPVDYEDVAANERCVYHPFPVPIPDHDVSTCIWNLIQAERLSIIKLAIEFHAMRMAEGRPLETPWLLNSYVDPNSRWWKHYIWEFVRATLVPNEGWNIDKQQIYDAFLLALKAGGITENCLPGRNEFGLQFNSVFHLIFKDFAGCLKQVRSSRSGKSLKGIENFGFHPERFSVRHG